MGPGNGLDSYLNIEVMFLREGERWIVERSIQRC
jgi:hypothetical protein